MPSTPTDTSPRSPELEIPDDVAGTLRQATLNELSVWIAYTDSAGQYRCEYGAALHSDGSARLLAWLPRGESGLHHHVNAGDAAIEIILRDPHLQIYCRISGIASSVDDAAVRDRVHAELPQWARQSDPSGLGLLTSITITRIAGHDETRGELLVGGA